MEKFDYTISQFNFEEILSAACKELARQGKLSYAKSTAIHLGNLISLCLKNTDYEFIHIQSK